MDWRPSLELVGQPPPSDTAARFHHYFFGGQTLGAAPAEVSGRDLEESLDAAVAHYYEGLGWAAQIGAVNFEAALYQAMGNTLVRGGRLEAGVEASLVAEELAESIGSFLTRDLSQYHLVVAAMLGHDVGRTPYELLVGLLESCIRVGHPAVAAYVVKPAARLLAKAGRMEAAALAMMQPDVGFSDTLPDLGIENIPADAWESARRLAPTLDPLDVAERALRELQSLESPLDA